MGLFSSKSKISKEELNHLNGLLALSLMMSSDTGTWQELPEDIDLDTKEKVISVRKLVFEYIRQLKEAGFYSNGAVQKFVKDEYSWVNKENTKMLINLGQYI